MRRRETGGGSGRKLGRECRIGLKGDRVETRSYGYCNADSFSKWAHWPSPSIGSGLNPIHPKPDPVRETPRACTFFLPFAVPPFRHPPFPKPPLRPKSVPVPPPVSLLPVSRLLYIPVSFMFVSGRILFAGGQPRQTFPPYGCSKGHFLTRSPGWPEICTTKCRLIFPGNATHVLR